MKSIVLRGGGSPRGSTEDHTIYLEASGAKALGRKRELPLERDVRKTVLRTKPDSHANETVKGTLRDKVGSTELFP